LKNNVIALIPARSGSKGITNKNIKLIAGKPLLAWSIETCKKSKLIKKVLVSTDSKKYSNIAMKFGADKVIMRPKKLSGDFSTDYEWINHCISSIKNIDYQIIAHIRPTTPIRKLKDLENAINLFSKSKMSALRSVHQMAETAYKSFEVKKKLLQPLKNINYDLNKLNMSRQIFPKTYSANGVIDLYKKDFIIKNHKLFGEKVLAFETNYTHEIDNLSEFNYINYLLKNDKN
tara:strand:+ start:285 stop:980 length:696 start_codon:yes stop_codon:yes gene_type:complete